MPNWKDALLKSSLPLEQVVMETLELSSFCVAGPYSYSRLDDSATGNEFSVDLAASRELTGPDGSPLAVLHILVECKYQYPGVRWIFSASAAGTPAVAGPIAHVSDTDTGKMSGANALLAIEDALPYCTRGVVLHEGGVDSNTIDHGLGQLRLLLRGRYAVDAQGLNKVKGQPFKVSEVRERILESFGPAEAGDPRPEHQAASAEAGGEG